jgi:2'-5' RNA ligase
MPNWNYCVVARFDDVTNQKLTDLKAAFLAEGYGGVATHWPPHITLAVYETVSPDALKAWTADYAQTQSKFTVALGSCGLFPPGGDKAETAVLYAAPASSKRLMDFYFGYHEKLDEYGGNSGWLYSAAFGHPAIHATIGVVEVKRLQRALELVFAGGIFGKSQIQALEVYKYPMELVARYELC